MEDLLKTLSNYGVVPILFSLMLWWWFTQGTKLLWTFATNWTKEVEAKLLAEKNKQKELAQRSNDYQQLRNKDSTMGNELNEISKQAIINKHDIGILNKIISKLESKIEWQERKIKELLNERGFIRFDDSPPTSPPTLPKLPSRE